MWLVTMVGLLGILKIWWEEVWQSWAMAGVLVSVGFGTSVGCGPHKAPNSFSVNVYRMSRWLNEYLFPIAAGEL